MVWPGGYRCARRSGFTLVELLLVVAIIAILAALALPNYTRIKDKAKEAEVKANLHNIQATLERFAVDNDGWYPPYLIGGDNEWMETGTEEDSALSKRFRTIPAEQCSDPLLRYGYLESYPRNPFVRDQLPVMQLQGIVGDPLRSTFADGRRLGTRFGARGNVMGQTLCDARWLRWTYHDLDRGEEHQRNTWANVQYPFYDVWNGNQRRPFLPGSFLYKSAGEVLPTEATKRKRQEISVINPIISINPKQPREATVPISISNYMLGAWGSTRNKGIDLLGEEPLVIFTIRRDGNDRLPYAAVPYLPVFGGLNPGTPVAAPSGSERVDVFGVPPWTRGVNRSHVGPLWGSPFGPSQATGQQLSYGNPNGFKDSIILWLGPGSDDE